MQKNKDLIKTVAVLFIIALVCGALLGLFYQITFITDEEKDQRAIKKLQEINLDGLNPEYKKIPFDSGDDELMENIQYFFADEQLNIYAIVATGDRGFKDKVPLYVIIKDDTIIALKEGSIKETPGVSDDAFSDEFFDRFLEQHINVLDIDNVDVSTGATYSKNAVKSSLKNAIAYYKEYKASKEI